MSHCCINVTVDKSVDNSYVWGYLTGLYGWHDVLEGIATEPEEFRRGMADGIKIRMQNEKSLLPAWQTYRN